jgi:hypothetical protein
MTQQPQRRPGDSNPTPDADAPMRPVREAESLAMGAGTAGGPFGTGGGGIAKGIFTFLDWRRRRKAARRTA